MEAQEQNQWPFSLITLERWAYIYDLFEFLTFHL